MNRRFQRSLIAPVGALLIAAAASLWMAVGFIRPVALPEHNPQPRAPVVDSAVPAEKTTVLSIEANPFRSDRRAAPARFRMPGDGAGLDAGLRPPVASSLILIGTAVLPGGGSFAMCQIAGEPPRLVRIGERFAGLTLRRVSQGQATFSTPSGTSLEVRVAKAVN